MLRDLKIDDKAINLIEKLLEKNPIIRLSAEEALQHPLVAGDNVMQFYKISLSRHQKVIKNLIKFRAHEKLQQAVLLLMIHQIIDEKVVKDQKKIFIKLDKNNDGILEKEDIQIGIDEIYKDYPDLDIDDLYSLIDLNGNGKIEYSEWLVATLNIEDDFF